MSGPPQAPPIPRLPPSESYPLSPYQRGLWALLQMYPHNPCYNGCRIIKLGGLADFAIFRRALQAFINRHDIWRAGFVESEQGAVQRIARRLEIACPLEELTELKAGERDTRVAEWIAETAWQPFDLSRAPLARWRAFRFGREDYRVVLSLHHLISDGGSLKLMMEELAALCRAPGDGFELPPPELQYQDFSCWQNARIASGELAESEAYWRRRLGGELPALDLPADRSRPTVPSYRGGQHRLILSPGLSRRLRELRRRYDTTVFRLMLAAFKTLLARLSGETDIIVGSPVSGRIHPSLRSLQGDFVNMLALRTDLGGDPPFGEVVERVKESTREAIEHKEFPFDTLVHLLNPRRDPGRPPIFNVMMVMREPTFTHEFPAGEVVLTQDEAPLTRVSRYDLTIVVAKTAASLRFTFEYASDLFNATTIARLAAGFERLLEGIVGDPGQRISRLPILSEAQSQAVLREWNDTRRDHPQGSSLDELCAAQAARTPEAVAVVFAGQRLSYRALDERANQLAHYLRRLGVGPEVMVGICLERSLDLVVGLLGILKAGGAYVPLDPSYPQERLTVILEDCRAPVVVTSQEPAEILPEQEARRVLVDGEREMIDRQSPIRPASGTAAGNLAYAIYTSGSTGRPKGVAIEHRSAVTLMHWAREVFSCEELSGVLASTSICFDLSVFELFVPLAWGGTVILARDALELPTLVSREQVTLVNTVPSAIAELVRQDGLPARARTVNLAGEPLRRALVDQVYCRPAVERVFNLYGPSEYTTYATFTRVERDSSSEPTIGRPVADTRVSILDSDGRPVAVGVFGELCLSGVGLAREYIRQPGLTAEKFVPDALSSEPGARLYKTGDVARYHTDGELEFCGRIDHQIKLRGFRIELGEIEAALSRHPRVREAVLLVREDPSGDQRLMACVVFEGKPSPTVHELRDSLRAKLPHYMVPAGFVILDEMPRTPNGKVDRKALRAAGHDPHVSTSAYAPPRDAVEWETTRLWEEILGRQGIGVHDHFFEIGGHSLLAVALVGKIYQRLGVDLPVTALMQAPTIAGVSAAIRQRCGEVSTAVDRFVGGLVPIRAGESAERPLFFIHAFRGGVFAYHALANVLRGRYPIYAFQALGLAEGEEPLESIPEMARCYVRRMRQRQPAGPYRLVGWSFGGTVAYEITRQLESVGERVALLVLLDASLPDDMPAEISMTRSLSQIGHALFGFDERELEGLDEPRALARLLERGQATDQLPAGMTAAMLERLVKVVRANAKAIHRYRGGDRVRANIHLLQSEIGSQVRRPEAWRNWTEGTYTVLPVPGPHHNMLDPPAVVRLAEVLSSVIETETETS